MADLVRPDLDFILAQILIAENHARDTWTFNPGDPTINAAAGQPLSFYIDSPQLSTGLRTVDGRENNLLAGNEEFGAADTIFPRLLTPRLRDDQDGDSFSVDTNGPAPGGTETLTNTNYNTDFALRGQFLNPGPTQFFVHGDVVDADPRIATVLITDQSQANPAAVARWNALNGFGPNDPGAMTVQPRKIPHPDQATTHPGVWIDNPLFQHENLFIQNVAPDEGLSAPFNSWMTLFGQFFDHGLDLVAKGGNGTVYIPLNTDDPLYDFGADGVVSSDDGWGANGVPGGGDDSPNFMTLTRAEPFGWHAGVDGQFNTADDVYDHKNTTTSWVDQNQTYTSHASHQVFLREYELNTAGDAVSTGKLLEGATGGLATWGEIKAQAANMLGIILTDHDVTNVPLLATDEYGRFIRDGAGNVQFVTATGLVSAGSPGSPVAIPSNVVRTGHAFLDDIAHSASPFFDADRNPSTAPVAAIADSGAADLLVTNGVTGVGDDGDRTTYDNELLDAHYITGDGRGNENIGLTAVHHVFHSEHNRLVETIKHEVAASVAGSTDPAQLTFLNQWLDTAAGGVPANNPAAIAAFVSSADWNGERVFQAARFGTEMQYQHLVFEEFGRKLQPAIDVFSAIQTDIDAAIVGEFAHVVYRFGHSMLTETVDRFDVNGVAVLEGTEQIGLIEAFLNPLEYRSRETSSGVAAGEVIRGMTRQVANEIDEFVTGALQNNLLGLPLDLGVLNIARGRDTGMPGLNAARTKFFSMTADTQLKPYASWNEFGANLRHGEEALINFVAAFGTHTSVANATTLEAKRDAAVLLVKGNTDINGDNVVDVAPADRLAFMNSTGAWTSGSNGTITGLDDVDFWIGGLAEKAHPFGGILGTTFGFVFETQMEKLQDGDRMYYLARTAGLPFLAELEGNSFAKIVMANTDVTRLPGDIFARPDFILEVNLANQHEPDPTGDDGIAIRNNPATPGPDSNFLQYSGGAHVVLGGTSANDILIASIGDDSIWGDDGNDRIEGGAGNDMLMGGAGDDIIQDSFGDDNLKGEDGNDAINAGAGIDLIISGKGNDFVVVGQDEKETIAGEGNDFILGGNSFDTVFGDEGNDWIEGGNSADLLQGDTGDPFQLAPTGGNDVIIGGGGNDDYDSEAGDDILVGGQGTERWEGMLGFDWVTFARDTVSNDADMLFTGLVAPTVEPLRDRMDLVEGLSGWDLNDTLKGDNKTSLDLLLTDPGSFNQNNALNSQTQIGLITGLQALLDGMLGGAQTSFSGGNILLGGGGNDTIEGRGGNDLIDGDKWLNVKITWTDNNGIQRFANSMTEIQAQVFAGTLNPGKLSIVREIVTGKAGNDTVVYNDIAANYSVDLQPDDGVNGKGTWTVVDNQPLVAGPTVGVFAPPLDEGTDTLRNVEFIQFSDITVNLNPLAANQAATGTISISGDTDQGKLLTASASGLVDVNGMVNTASLQFHWEAETTPGNWTRLQTNSDTFTSTNAQVGQQIRVVATFEDNLGHSESLTSNTVTIGNVNDAPSGSDAELTTTEDVALVFTAANFGFSDPDAGDSMSSVTINTLPLNGELWLGATQITTPGFNILFGDIGQLEFRPAVNANAEPYASFEFTVNDQNGGTDATPNTVWINVLAANDAPEGTNGSVTFDEDTVYTFTTGDFGFTDIDAGDGLRSVRFDSLPAGGTLYLGTSASPVAIGDEILEPQITAGLLRFEPNQHANGVGYASFNFTVRDLANAYDDDANTLTLNITPVNDAPTGSVSISDTTPTRTQALTANVTAITDADGVNALSYEWQFESSPGVWQAIAGAPNSASFTPGATVVGKVIRVQVSYTDNDGTLEKIISPATAIVGDFYTGNTVANVKNLTGGADIANGLGGNDVLRGFAGDDLLNGGTGNDSLIGGDDNDTLNGDDGTDNLDGGLGNDTLNGGNQGDTLLGGDGDDILNGGADAGIDFLIGGIGADIMTGGGGNDTYDVDDAGDQVIELAGGGTDTIETEFTTFSLAGYANVENLTFTGLDPVTFTGTGNALVNRIDGGDGNDRLDGGGVDNAIDTLIGGIGDDTYVIHQTTSNDVITELAGAGTDTVESIVTYTIATQANLENVNLMGAAAINATGNANINVLNGNSNNNLLQGGTNNDTMNGGGGADVFDLSSATGTLTNAAGADTMTGSTGNDTYGVDNVGDVVIELNGTVDGTDAIRTTLASFDMSVNGLNVENLTYIGAGVGFTGIGNNQANVINTQGATALTLNDTITGGGGNDTVTMNAGDDRFIATVGDGVDIINGGTNTVSTTGLTGGDTYDASLTGATAGITVTISGTNLQVLGSEVGTDTLTGIENIIGSSNNDSISVNGGVNRLDGGGGNDNLDAGSGNDTLIGGTGNDIMIGGLGNDIFVFAAMGFGNDQITGSATTRFDADVTGGQDLIDLTALAPTINAGNFASQVIIDDSSGTDTLITFAPGVGSTDSILLVGVNGVGANDISIADFILTP